jgi:hypothetical protein
VVYKYRRRTGFLLERSLQRHQGGPKDKFFLGVHKHRLPPNREDGTKKPEQLKKNKEEMLLEIIYFSAGAWSKNASFTSQFGDYFNYHERSDHNQEANSSVG